ncbi:hypothetical protein J4226_02450 [Candidatus Pacearchaeota archaeon]|nr:hypothetical protein [Candidatus Pacearchaeota archaeon]
MALDNKRSAIVFVDGNTRSCASRGGSEVWGLGGLVWAWKAEGGYGNS